MNLSQDSRYMQLVVNEFYLFDQRHFEAIAQLLSSKRDQVDGVCFIVQSGVELGKVYKLYVPFYEDDLTYISPDMVISRTMAAMTDMTSQMSQLNQGLIH